MGDIFPYSLILFESRKASGRGEDFTHSSKLARIFRQIVLEDDMTFAIGVRGFFWGGLGGEL